MRSISTILVLLTLVNNIALNAQNQKVGFIDSDVIMDQMPEYTGIEQRLTLLSESWHDEIRAMDREIEQLEEEFEAREILYTEEMRESVLEDINELADNRDRFLQEKFGPEGDYFQRQRDLLEPVQRQVFDAVNRVASREEYDFVFDRAQDVRFLFARSEWDLTDEVLAELGILNEE
ncbi:MAG: OmpH family outer membrane protein [Balneolaceae bacterium]